MDRIDLEDLHDNIIDETHPEDAKRHLATVLTIPSLTRDGDPDPDGLLGDLFDVIWIGEVTDSDLAEPTERALDHIVGLGYDPVPLYGTNWKDRI